MKFFFVYIDDITVYHVIKEAVEVDLTEPLEKLYEDARYLLQSPKPSSRDTIQHLEHKCLL